MKQLVFFLLFSIALQSQDFSKVDHLVATYPHFSNVTDLADKIERDFNNDSDKVRAAFFWLATNFRYNLKEYYNPKKRRYNFRYSSEQEKQQKLQAIKDAIVAVAFRTKYGVCEEYAQAFKKICDLLQIEAEVIVGNVRINPNEIGKPKNTTNHAWNGVKVNGKWLIVDATWAAGFEQNGRWVKQFDNYFYNIPKEHIFKTHYPEDTLWRLRCGRMNPEEFYNQPVYGKAFLNSKAELVSPKTGILKVNSSNEIKLKFKNLNTSSSIFYTLKGQPYAKKPLILIENNMVILTFKNAPRNSYLNLFINKEAALQFRTK